MFLSYFIILWISLLIPERLEFIKIGEVRLVTAQDGSQFLRFRKSFSLDNHAQHGDDFEIIFDELAAHELNTSKSGDNSMA